ncbi:hypothetical protein [Vallitalea okinawensis]|uniref:hypothetical protein n=1 Tax=Vallitalea okinawensis TaxID=2078660 RepID=UPI000CFBDA71|nr:hypothetical protein [Vallitalea okinawensis]
MTLSNGQCAVQPLLDARFNDIEKRIDNFEKTNELVIEIKTTMTAMTKQLESQVETLENINKNMTNLNLQQEKISMQMDIHHDRIMKLEQENENTKIDINKMIKDFIIKTIIPIGIMYVIFRLTNQ